MDFRLNASFYACNIISIRVNASLCWVDLHDLFELGFASLQLCLPVHTVRFAQIKEHVLGVDTSLDHVLVARRSNEAPFIEVSAIGELESTVRHA